MNTKSALTEAIDSALDVCYTSLPWFIENPKSALESYLSPRRIVVLDFETSNLDKGSALNPDNHIILACWKVVDADGTAESKHHWGDEYDQAELETDILSADFIVAHNCFSGDTRFITDEGSVSFKEAVGTTVNVWNEEGWQPAEVKHYGKSVTKKITLVPYNRSRTSIVREVVATPNHRWKVDRIFNSNKLGRYRAEKQGYVTTDELRIGDKVWAQAPDVRIEENSDGFRHGLIFADGAKCSDRRAYQIRLCGHKEKYKNLFRAYTYPPSANGDPVVNRYKSLVDLKKVPSEDSSTEYKAQFIEGWQRLDGTDSGNGTSRTVTTISKEAAEWLRDNATEAGYFCSGFSSHEHSGGYTGTGEYYMVTITKNSDMGWTVRSVEDSEEQDVYCVEVAGLDRFTLAHGIYTGNCKFEMQWLKRMGMELRDILCYDTMLGEWVRAGNRVGQAGWELNLDDTAKRYGLKGKAPIPSMMLKMGISTADIPVEYLLPYCHDDVEQCYGVYLQQRELLHEDKLLHLALTRNLCCAALADIEFNGAELDAARVEEEYNKSIEEFRQLDDQLAAMCGGINLSSPKQLGEFLYDVLGFAVPKDHYGKELKTAKGLPKTDVKTLDKLVASSDKQREFLSLYKRRNKLDSLITKNLDFFMLVCQQRAGRFYGNINQGFTQTHRLAATGRPILFEGIKTPKGIQFQNMVRAYKKLFAAHDPDYVDCEADGAQLEFRVGVEMSNDEAGRLMILNGEDVHADTAQVFMTWNDEKPNKHPDFMGLNLKQARQPAKPFTFMPMYGGNGKHPAENEYALFFRDKYHGIATMQKDWCYEVLDSGRLRTPYGFLFHWPGTRMSAKGYIDNTTNISNYPIQQFATGEIIPIALVYFWQRSRNIRAVIWNTIHDSVATRVHKDDVPAYKEISKQSFTKDVYKFLSEVYEYEFSIPLAVGIKCGDYWGESPYEELWEVSPQDGTEKYVKK